VGEFSVALANAGSAGDPEGQPYDWYRRALALLEGGNPDAASHLLERLLVSEPTSLCALEAYARALFDARRYGPAADAFAKILDRAPDDDYAHFGLGMSLWHVQEFVKARDELAMAFVMRPTRPEYARALAQVKATLRSRIAGNLPLNGPVSASFPADPDSSRPVDWTAP
jgi:predicted Zn-dependent protease